MTPRIDWPAVRAAAAPFRIAMPRSPVRGGFGERLGTNAGSSLEFQDYRQYAAGDDLRHVDWAAYARSEVLTVRLYREEVAPRIDLVIDTSRSMAVSEAKAAGYAQVLALAACASASSTASVQLLTGAGAEPAPLMRPEELERHLQCSSAVSALEGGPLPLRRLSVRVIVSDFLFPHDPDALVARLARGAASLTVVQFTAREEADPGAEGGVRFVDVEGHGELDIVLDSAAIGDYRERFNRLRRGLEQASRRVGAHFVHLTAGMSPRETARLLATAGLLETA